MTSSINSPLPFTPIERPVPVHPTYGTCPNCIKGVRILKDGYLKDHQTPLLVHPSFDAIATFHCPGSGARYTEFNGRTWALGRGDWQRLPLAVPVQVTELRAPDDWQTRYVQVRVSVANEAAIAYLHDGTWRIEVVTDTAIASATLLKWSERKGGYDVYHGPRRWQHDGPVEAARNVQFLLDRLIIAAAPQIPRDPAKT